MRLRNSIKLFCLALTLLLTLPIAGKSDSVSDLMKQQQDLTAKINSNRQTIDNLQKELDNLNTKLSADQKSVDEIARSLQVSNPTRSLISMMLSSKSFSEFIEQMVAVNLVNASAKNQIDQLKETKTTRTTALEELKAQQVQLDQESQTLKESLQKATPPASFTPQNADLADFGATENEARANIVARESGGNYEAVNGIMYGAYQMAGMTPGTPPAEQDAIAQAYVVERYGSWANAWAFWINNGWY